MKGPTNECVSVSMLQRLKIYKETDLISGHLPSLNFVARIIRKDAIRKRLFQKRPYRLGADVLIKSLDARNSLFAIESGHERFIPMEQTVTCFEAR